MALLFHRNKIDLSDSFKTEKKFCNVSFLKRSPQLLKLNIINHYNFV